MINLLILALFCCGFEARAEVRPFQAALIAIDSGDRHGAYKLLENIPSSDPDFASAVGEIQKLHYRHQDWRKFFAYAQFYRLKYLSEEARPVSGRLIALEAMALAKHCRWSNADGILAWAQSQRRRMTQDDWSEVEAAGHFVDLQRKVPGAATAAHEDQKKVAAAFTREQAWKIEAKALAAIGHPKVLSVNVKSECR